MTDTALALGSFDGLHVAHMKVLSSAASYSAVAVLFDVPPAMEMSGKRELLLPLEEKHKILENMGFSVEVLDFSAVKDVFAEDFLLGLYETYAPRKICCGFNYSFGKGGKGNTEKLKAFCNQKGIELCIIDAVEMDGSAVSSTRIRELLKSGDVKSANKLLGRDYAVKGRVSHGDKRGRTLGYPTVNFMYPQDMCEVKHGVYATTVMLENNEYCAVTYVGKRPTYKLDDTICETNIIDFKGDLYGKEIIVNFKRFLREEKTFDSTTELKEQIYNDIKAAKEEKL